MQIPTVEMSNNNGIVTITPLNKTYKFEKIDTVEVRKGIVYGWVTGAQIKDLEVQYLCHVGFNVEVELIAADEDMVVLRTFKKV